MKKRGMVINQTAKLILAVAVFIVLMMLVGKLFVFVYDRGDETAKSYLEILKDQIEIADDGGRGEFFLWYVGGRKDTKEFYLAYFGETYEIDFVRTVLSYGAPIGGIAGYYRVPVDQNVQFNSFGRNKNRICICIVEGSQKDNYESVCDYCEDLEHPVIFPGKDEVWYDESGKRISIELKEGKYVFTEIR